MLGFYNSKKMRCILLGEFLLLACIFLSQLGCNWSGTAIEPIYTPGLLSGSAEAWRPMFLQTRLQGKEVCSRPWPPALMVLDCERFCAHDPVAPSDTPVYRTSRQFHIFPIFPLLSPLHRWFENKIRPTVISSFFPNPSSSNLKQASIMAELFPVAVIGKSADKG